MLDTSSSLSVLIVDDEEPARLRIKDLLLREPGLKRLLEAANGEEAVLAIEEEKPDLVLLDVQMPGLDGFGVVEVVGAASMPLTIFVTAYDQHAIRAFEASALDYLLKPYSDSRLLTAISRARARLKQVQTEAFFKGFQIAAYAQSPAEPFLDRLPVRTAGRIQFLQVSQIQSIEASGTYVTLHPARGSFLHREPLTLLLRKLDPQCFIRIHRSTVVNVAKIAELESLPHGEYDATMKDGKQYRVSRTYRSLLERRFGGVL